MVELELGTLNNLLKGELSAVASYEKALELVEEQRTADVLQQVRSSHAERVDKLREAIAVSGGDPIEESGPWGNMATMLTKTAGSVGGDTALLTVLEEGEDIGLNDYEWTLVKMHGEHRDLVKKDLFRKQKATHKLMSRLLNRCTDGAWPPVPDEDHG